MVENDATNQKHSFHFAKLGKAIKLPCILHGIKEFGESQKNLLSRKRYKSYVCSMVLSDQLRPQQT